ncbi:MAG: hypothetical protein EBV86_15425 [Marivivens sp.]|nr:hypothetical protein [Marivivens sp.]
MGTNLDLSTLLTTSSNFGTTWKVAIDANDKVEISADVAFKIQYNSSSGLTGVADVFGIGTSFITSGGASGISPFLANSLSAPSDWIRGEIVALSYTIREVGGASEFTFNFTGGAQDLIVACRSRGNGDIDDLNTGTLEGADKAVTSTDTRWFVNNDGHVVNSAIATAAWSWNSSDTSIRDYLGFTGNEAVTLVNGYCVGL